MPYATSQPILLLRLIFNHTSPSAATEISRTSSSSDITPATIKSMATDINPIILNDNWNFTQYGTSVLHVNCQGLLGSYRNAMHHGNHTKLDHFQYLLSLPYAPSVFCLSETKLNSKINDKELNITNYSFFHQDRSRQGGGIAIFCSNDLKPKKIINTEAFNIVLIALKVFPHGQKATTIICMYRLPSSKSA